MFSADFFLHIGDISVAYVLGHLRKWDLKGNSSKPVARSFGNVFARFWLILFDGHALFHGSSWYAYGKTKAAAYGESRWG